MILDVDAMKDEIKKELDDPFNYIVKQDAYNTVIDIIDHYIESRQTAEWEKFGKNTYACTNCRRGVFSKENYCPECGRKMLKG